MSAEAPPPQIASHGGAAVQAIVAARPLPVGGRRLQVDALAAADLYMLGCGAYAPLQGFMGAADRQAVERHLRLVDGTLWPLPITLPLGEAEAQGLTPGTLLQLCDGEAQPLGELTVTEVYRRDPAAEARATFGTDDAQHPGVAVLLGRGPLCAAGPVRLYEAAARRRAEVAGDSPCLLPAEARAVLAARGWRRVVGFQTRNPVHRAHEYILRCALEICDGLLLHPLVGPTKADDIPAAVRMDCYRALLGAALPGHSVVLSALPAPMRYGGPREALLHAIVRQNYGCTHFIVGRDHAGVGRYYGTYAAQQIFATLWPGALAIEPLCFEHTFYCGGCGQVASPKTCPHPADARQALSGTEVRAMLGRGERPPPSFTRPEVAAVLAGWARP